MLSLDLRIAMGCAQLINVALVVVTIWAPGLSSHIIFYRFVTDIFHLGIKEKVCECKSCRQVHSSQKL